MTESENKPEPYGLETPRGIIGVNKELMALKERTDALWDKLFSERYKALLTPEEDNE